MEYTDGSVDVNAIRALYATWFSAMERGDVAAILSLVTPNVIVAMPGTPQILGRDALGEALRAFFQANTERVDYEIEGVKVDGDLAFARISETATIGSKTGARELTVEGVHLVDLCRQADGRWLVSRDVSSLCETGETH